MPEHKRFKKDKIKRLTNPPGVNTTRADYPYLFSVSLRAVASPIFDNCVDNLEVARELREASILKDTYDEASLPHHFFLYFRTKEEGHQFIEDLNAYMDRKALVLSHKRNSRKVARG